MGACRWIFCYSIEFSLNLQTLPTIFFYFSFHAESVLQLKVEQFFFQTMNILGQFNFKKFELKNLVEMICDIFMYLKTCLK